MEISIEQKIILLENIQNSTHFNFTYKQTIDIIGYIEPDIKSNIEKQIDILDLSVLHGKNLQETIDNIICTSIDNWIISIKDTF